MSMSGGRLQGDRVKLLRERKGLTQDELGVLLKMDGRQILRYEKEQTDPNSEIIGQLTYHLETNANYLLGLSIDDTPELRNEDLSAEERALVIALRNRRSDEVVQLIATLLKEPT